jgi:hypothetical protein
MKFVLPEFFRCLNIFPTNKFLQFIIRMFYHQINHLRRTFTNTLLTLNKLLPVNDEHHHSP